MSTDASTQRLTAGPELSPVPSVLRVTESLLPSASSNVTTAVAPMLAYPTASESTVMSQVSAVPVPASFS